MIKKGKLRTEEAKRKTSESLKLFWQTHTHPSKGKKRGPQSEEHKRKRLESVNKYYENHPGVNTGKKLGPSSAETRKKQSKSMKEYYKKYPEAKHNSGTFKKGHKNSEEARRKQSKSLKLYYKTHTSVNKGRRRGTPSEETRRKLSNGNKGKHNVSEETKKQISSRQLKYYENHSNLNKGKTFGPLSNEQKRKISDALKGKKHYNWKGGKYPIKSPGWNIIRKEAKKLADYKSELSGRTGKLDVHHMISRRQFCDFYFNLMYNNILNYDINNLLHVMVKNRRNQNIIPLIYPSELFVEFDELTNLIVLTHSEHAKNEGQPPSFFLQV